MAEKIHCLLILCGILCIKQILADESSDHLVRRKRVINLEPGRDVPLQNGDIPFIANIRLNVSHTVICVGVILSKHTVITVADCVANLEPRAIEVLVGSAYSHYGVHHDVIMKRIHYGDHRRNNNDGIALLTVIPAIIFVSTTDVIQLYQGPLLEGMPTMVFGWGYNSATPRGTDYRTKLRGINVPIMNHAECANIYRNHFVISNNDICTYHPKRRCGHTDGGAPLVVDNKLAGLHLWRNELACSSIHPDIFVNLQSSEYASFIRNNTIYNVNFMGGTH